jgi:hypothetical protein
MYSMWTKVIPFPPSSLYISYKTIYFHNILMKSFLWLIWFSWNFQHWLKRMVSVYNFFIYRYNFNSWPVAFPIPGRHIFFPFFHQCQVPVFCLTFQWYDVICQSSSAENVSCNVTPFFYHHS